MEIGKNSFDGLCIYLSLQITEIRANSAGQKPLIGRSHFTACRKNRGKFAKNNIASESRFNLAKWRVHPIPLSSNGFRENVLHEKREKKVKFDVFPV